MSEWRVEALKVIRDLAERDYAFSSDDVHHLAGDPPDPNGIGQVFKEAIDHDIIEGTGDWVRSRRKEAKGRRIPLYRGKKTQALF